MPHANNSAPQPDARVQIGDCKATVKYVGEVQGQTGSWVGVEWDDSARGKNNGSTGDQSYFSCRAPNAGSFLRLEKYGAEVKVGCTVLAALQGRYGDQNGDHPTEEVEQRPKPGGKKAVEWQFVGADKVHAQLSQTHTLEKATLINCSISSVVRLSSLAIFTFLETQYYAANVVVLTVRAMRVNLGNPFPNFMSLTSATTFCLAG